MPLRDGPLAAGTYVANPFLAPNDSISFTFVVPDGWVGFGDIGLTSEKGTGAPDGMAMGFNLVGDLYSDPCHGNAADVTVGPTVDDLASALADQTAYDATIPTDVTLGGYSGKRVDLQLPSDPEFGRCTGGFYVWEEDPQAPGGIYAQGPGNRWHVWILDVDGVRVVILANDYAGTSTQDQAEWQAIVNSIQIQP
jgi:hypothetical protein